jgi:heat shock protein HspQ
MSDERPAGSVETPGAAGRVARFSIGRLVSHRLFGYRGVVFDVDPEFRLPEEWYEQVARSRPPKDRPWYHVLVDGADHVTYVAERNLDPDTDGGPVRHPMLSELFEAFENGVYRPRQRAN